MYLGDFKVKISWHEPAIASALLLPLSIYNSLLFHTLVESFAIIVAVLIFVVANSTYRFSKSHFLMFLGSGYFWIGILDFCHTISFSSFNIFPNVTLSTTLQFWMAARLMEAFVLLRFTHYIDRPVNRRLFFWGFGLVFMAMFFVIVTGILPDLFHKDEGLTGLKIAGEYFLILLLGMSGWRIRKYRSRFNPSIYQLIIFSIGLTIAAEASFTLYTSFSGTMVVVGHLFKLLSFWLIFLALVESTLKQPFKILSLSSDTFNALPDAIAVVDKQGIILHANRTTGEPQGKEHTIIGQSVHTDFHDGSISQEQCSICRAIISGAYTTYHEIEVKGEWYEITLSEIDYWRQNGAVLHVSRNISQKIEAQTQLRTIDRLYTVLRLTNKAIISSKNKQELLSSVCKIAVEYGGFSMAWIGMIQGQKVVPVSSSGDRGDYLSNIRVTVDDSELSKGPVGIAANQRLVAFVNNIDRDPSFKPWRENALQQGFNSMAAIPVIQNEQCIGVFAIYSKDLDAFDHQVLDLLSSLSHDISSIMTYIQTEEKRVIAERKLKPLSRAIEQSKNSIVISNLKGEVEYINPYFEEMTGYQQHELMNKTIDELPIYAMADAILIDCWKAIDSAQEFHGEIECIKKDGNKFWGLLSVAPIKNKSEIVSQIVWTTKDNTELHHANETITQLAYYDALTNLPNRRLFHDRCTKAISSAKRNSSKLALFYFDLDNFKKINDSWGHNFGDLLLVHVAQTLCRCVRDTDTVTRLGGDEFSILLTDVSDVTKVEKIAAEIQSKLNQKTLIEGRELVISTSIGIGLFPEDATNINQLMKYADMAMYHAKEKGKNNFQFYKPFLNINMQQRVQMESNIRKALEYQLFELYYQPQINIQTGELCGVEALIRWKDSKGCFIPPNVFIPIAEESSLILEIGRWVARHACNEFVRLIDSGLPPIKIAINVSARQFQQSHFVQAIVEVLNQSKLPGHLLQLELTESILVEDVNKTIAIIDELKQQKLSFAIDDFGTGYSSFSYLKSFPVDIIKIDRSFIRDIEYDLNNRAIISAMIMMSNELGMKVLAEGVENKLQLDFLKKHHCDLAQGYYFDKALSAENLLAKYAT